MLELRGESQEEARHPAVSGKRRSSRRDEKVQSRCDGSWKEACTLQEQNGVCVGCRRASESGRWYKRRLSSGRLR